MQHGATGIRGILVGVEGRGLDGDHVNNMMFNGFGTVRRLGLFHTLNSAIDGLTKEQLMH